MMKSMTVKRSSIIKDVPVLLLMLVASLACFYDVLNLHFFSDDFYVIHRLTIRKEFWAVGFFRPLSDLTLLFSYWLSGYDAFGYRLFNVLLHGANAFLFYKVLLHFTWPREVERRTIAFIAALLFVFYPFHTEPMIWIVGRASMVANFFGILSLYFFFSIQSYRWKILLSCLTYFVGLASYESIIILPGIIFFAVWHRADLRKAIMTTIPFAITLAVHILLRVYVSGVFAGNYGKDMYGEGQTNYLLKFIKSFGRLFVPGIHSNQLLIGLFAFFFFLIALSVYLVYRFRRSYFNVYILFWIFLLVSQVIPLLFGVDTHTSDGDRLLYFPSFFLCSILAFFIWMFCKQQRSMWAVTLIVCAIFFYFVTQANTDWKKADAAITDIFNNINANCCGQVYFVNMPDAIEGSFVFRNGFYEALEMYKIKGKVRVVSNILNKQAILLSDTIFPVHNGQDSIFIPPATLITPGKIVADSMDTGLPVTKEVKRDSAAVILYWNRNKVVTLPH